MDSLSVAVCSFTSGPDKEKNIRLACDFTRKAAKAGAEWVILPEVFSYIGPYAKLQDMAEPVSNSPLVEQLARLARELKIVLFAGTVAVRSSQPAESRVYNVAQVFGRDGSLLGKYAKAHLFELKRGPNQSSYDESSGYLAGDTTIVLSIDGFKVGLAICYDLRFPLFFEELLAAGPCDILVVPAAFTFETGRFHWELLLRARAVEYQTYVLGSNQVGCHYEDKSSYGHSMIVDPWGEVLANTKDQVGFATAQISRSRLNDIREKLPALKNRRIDLNELG